MAMNSDLTKDVVKKMIDEIPYFVFKKLSVILSEYKNEENESLIIISETCSKWPVIMKNDISKIGMQMH